MDVGSIFDGRYRILGILGQGGMSKVYLAENIKLGTKWAIKEIRKEKSSRIDFYVEPNILKKLNHPSLPKIFDIIEDADFLYIIVDYIEGVSLDKELLKVGRFPEKTVLDWTRQICDVLLYLHNFKPNPIIYRDMKPSNIILTKDGGIKLIDFGIAREYKSNSESDTIHIGTRGYAAPEQYGGGQTNVTTDIYSLGVTMYCLLTGKSPNEPPYEIKPLKYFDSSFSDEIEHIIKKCTRQDPLERYQNVQEIIKEIDRINAPGNEGTEKGKKGKVLSSKYGHAVKGNFKKLVLTVWGNSEFGCELAYLTAKHTEFSVLLIDLDLLAPTADIFLNVPKYPNGIIRNGQPINSCLDVVMEAIDKNYLTADILADTSVKRRELKNLHVITGNYNLDNYEYYSDRSLIKLIEKAYQYFDITILLVNKSIYDSYTVISLAKSDYNIVSVRPDVEKLREYNSYLSFLKEKQHIPLNKTKFVAFNYDQYCINRKLTNEITGYNCIGCIKYSIRREKYRNLKAPYARRMEKDILYSYLEILSWFNILPKMSLIRKLGFRIAALSRRFKVVLRYMRIHSRGRRAEGVTGN